MAKKVTQVMKRDGSIEKFEPYKIMESIQNVLSDSKQENTKIAKKISKQVLELVEKSFERDIIPKTQDIEDVLLSTIQKTRYKAAAKAFLEHKQRHKAIVGFRTFMGVRDELNLSNNALRVMAKRCMLKNEHGRITETPSRLFRRIAKAIASVEILYNRSVKKIEEEFYKVLSNLDFTPNTTIMQNAGTKGGQLLPCFAIPVGDSLKEIFVALGQMAMIQQSGAGITISFSKLRPKGDIVRSANTTSSGPLSFMQVFDSTSEVISHGSARGIHKAMMDVDHPDIMDFINARENIKSFNLSIAVTNRFMEAVKKEGEIQLVNPRNKKIVRSIKAKEIFDLISSNTWKTGEPNIIFVDEVNKKNPTPMFKVEGLSSCGEQALLPHEGCSLGTINLSSMVVHGRMDWDKLKKTIRTSVHFLDNVIDANKYQSEQTEETAKANRKIGLGIIGFAEALIRMKIPYDSEKAVRFVEKLMKFISTEARKKSIDLGRERGSFPNLSNSVHSKQKAMRNATVTAIFPTATANMIANTSSGIEPLFGIAFARQIKGIKILEVNPIFEETARKRGFYFIRLMTKIAKTGTVKDMKEVPKDIRRLFVTSLDIKPEWHLKMQAAFQKFTDDTVSKNIILPYEARIVDVNKMYLTAHKLNSRTVNIYRGGSKKDQYFLIEKNQKGSCLQVSEYYAGGLPGKTCLN